ncbi:hypothetical protein BOTBODRAFT_253275 [Botryobasidium botryosum FD-172 SS1]|uniref:Uncharacterized protein n=1 Tax=Botryobasidium botryosum (strain FD-172 SS1) TaxID=930990 RepID=A0A067LT33_BOTB1|nr:hypothetical protein BOTBODRAFT_253275 [Botryobasidium botryosum FD-172 SS1]
MRSEVRCRFSRSGYAGVLRLCYVARTTSKSTAVERWEILGNGREVVVVVRSNEPMLECWWSPSIGAVGAGLVLWIAYQIVRHRHFRIPSSRPAVSWGDAGGRQR